MQAAEMLTSNPRLAGKMHFEAASDDKPYGNVNTGQWFKKVARPMV